MKPRPLSPHLQIYKPQLTSILSILHRLTGLYLSLGIIALIAWIIAVKTGPDTFTFFQTMSTSWVGLFLLFSWTLCLMYHFCNGIRHLFWDAGRGFSLRNAYLSGWTVVVVAIILTVIVWAVPFIFNNEIGHSWYEQSEKLAR